MIFFAPCEGMFSLAEILQIAVVTAVELYFAILAMFLGRLSAIFLPITSEIFSSSGKNS